MPRAAIDIGATRRVLPLRQMAAEIMRARSAVHA
jgi:chemotaxis response regulator CheB